MKRVLILALCVACLAATATAKVKLPAMVGDNMVLQRETGVNLWGWGKAGGKVTVTASWDGKSYQTVTDKDGRWIVNVTTPQAGGPYTIRISDGEPVVLNNIMIGEVWVCSGRSNMEMPMSGFYCEAVDNALPTVMQAGTYRDLIRMITVPKCSSPDGLKEDFDGKWAVSESSSAASCSATAYYFARNLADALDIPIGIIVTSWGGSSIEAWMDTPTAERVEGIDIEHVKSVKYDHMGLSYLYNGMIWPVKNFTARGFIWYQGETNRATFRAYAKTQAAMIKAWRNIWGNKDMPFYYVQIAPHSYGNNSDFLSGYMIEAQLGTMAVCPGTGMIPTSDIGDQYTIHPPQKDIVGQRLAVWALKDTYGLKGFPSLGPTYKNAEFREGVAIVEFDNADNGFMPRSGPVTGFELAGADKVFYPADASIVWGKKQVKVSSRDVPEPVAVRYAFRNYIESNLKNVYGLPAYPFRTDAWDYK